MACQQIAQTGLKMWCQLTEGFSRQDHPGSTHAIVVIHSQRKLPILCGIAEPRLAKQMRLVRVQGKQETDKKNMNF